MSLPEGAAGAPPEWLHLVPSGTFKGRDGRGPFHLNNPQEVITRSMQEMGGKLVIDENHSTDLAAPNGGSSPALGWIVELQSRANGIWGRVEWNQRGTELMSDKAYRGVSPVFASDKSGNVTYIARAALTNTPNLGVTQLHHQQQETGMDPKELRRLLGLPETASDTEVSTQLTGASSALSLHTSVLKLAGLQDGASNEAILAALRAKTEQLSTHAQQNVELQNKVQTLESKVATAEATRFVENEMTRKVINDTLKADLITLHAEGKIDLAKTIIANLPDVPDDRLSRHSSGADKPNKDAKDKPIAPGLVFSDEEVKSFANV